MIHIDIKKLGRFNRVGHRITGDRTGHASSRTRRQASASPSQIRSLIGSSSRSPTFASSPMASGSRSRPANRQPERCWSKTATAYVPNERVDRYICSRASSSAVSVVAGSQRSVPITTAARTRGIAASATTG
jgi:hypothetical protein